MKKTILYVLLMMFVVTTVFFIYENKKFKNYISSQNINEPDEMNIPINHGAPVKSQSEIIINAPIEKVWQVLTNINDWPAWQKEVTESTLKEELSEGVEFKWKAGGLSFTSQIHTIVPKMKFGWTGKTLGASVIHNWFFTDDGDKTTVRVEESLQGIFPRMFKGYFQRNLDNGVSQNLMDLKTASEK